MNPCFPLSSTISVCVSSPFPLQFWGVLWIVEKLILTTILSFITPGSALQVIVGMVVCFTSMLAVMQKQPFAGRRTNQIGMVGHTSLFLLFFVGLLLQLRVDLGSRDAALLSSEACPQAFFSACVGILVVILIAFAPALLLVALLLDDDEEHTTSR